MVYSFDGQLCDCWSNSNRFDKFRYKIHFRTFSVAAKGVNLSILRFKKTFSNAPYVVRECDQQIMMIMSKGQKYLSTSTSEPANSKKALWLQYNTDSISCASVSAVIIPWECMCRLCERSLETDRVEKKTKARVDTKLCTLVANTVIRHMLIC